MRLAAGGVLLLVFPEATAPFSVICLAGSGVDGPAVLIFGLCSAIGDSCFRGGDAST